MAEKHAVFILGQSRTREPLARAETAGQSRHAICKSSLLMESAAEFKRQFTCTVCAHPVEARFGEVATCTQCGHRDRRYVRRSSRLSLVFTLTALILYIPANIFPFMTIELYGNRNSSNIWQGITSLMDQRSYAIALVVFLASLLIPVVKLAILLFLVAYGGNGYHRRFKMRLYSFVEAIGRWSMLDIFLLAILVAMVKLGHWTTVEPEHGSVFFALVVVFTMMASAYFDPRILWEKDNETIHSA